MPALLERTNSITTEEVISKLIRYNGKTNLAAEVLHITEEQLLEILCADKLASESITEQIRLRILLKTYEQHGLLSDMLQQVIAKAEPSDVLKLYTTVAKTLAEMVGRPENTLESILKALPSNVRESVVRLMAG